MQKRKDLKNKRFGILTALKPSSKKCGSRVRTTWICKCDCGKECEIFTDNLQRQVSCGCKSDKYAKGIPSGLFQNIKQNAQKRKISFGLSKKDLLSIFTGKCYLTGEKIVFGRGRKWWVDNTASLDRIDSSKPYNKNNCAWCHKKINSAKKDLPIKEFLKWCRLIHTPIDDYAPTIYCSQLPRGGKWKTGIGNITGQKWCVILNNAEKRKIHVSVSIEEIWKKFLTQNGRCAITRVPLTMNVNKRGGFGTASLDRIDSNIGYTAKNIQWTHVVINTAFKWNLTQHEMYNWTKRVIDYENQICAS